MAWKRDPDTGEIYDDGKSNDLVFGSGGGSQGDNNSPQGGFGSAGNSVGENNPQGGGFGNAGNTAGDNQERWEDQWRRHQQEAADRQNDMMGGGFKPPSPNVPPNPGDNGGMRWNPNQPIYAEGYTNAPPQPGIPYQPDAEDLDREYYYRNKEADYNSPWNFAQRAVNDFFSNPTRRSWFVNPLTVGAADWLERNIFGNARGAQSNQGYMGPDLSGYASPQLRGVMGTGFNGVGAAAPIGSAQDKSNGGIPDYSTPPGSYAPPGAPPTNNAPTNDQTNTNPGVPDWDKYNPNAGNGKPNFRPATKDHPASPGYDQAVQPQVSAVAQTWGVSTEQAKHFIDAQYEYAATHGGQFPQGDALRELQQLAFSKTANSGNGGSGGRDVNDIARDVAYQRTSEAQGYNDALKAGFNGSFKDFLVLKDSILHRGNGGRGGGGSGGDNSSSTTPPGSTGTTNPTPTSNWVPQAYQSNDGIIKFDGRDWGTVSEQARPYVDAILRENGYDPTGTYGMYGATEYKWTGATPPQNIWFNDSVLSKLPTDIASEIRKLFAAKGWMLTSAPTS